MRMRKKKNLEERLEAVGDRLLVFERDSLDFRKAEDTVEYIDYKKVFKNDNPVFLEIGCGKGKFASEFSVANPDVNLIAVEKSANVIVTACENANRLDINNLVFLKCSAEYLNSYIPNGSIDRIFLNFSCPFPKSKYASHRLTADGFLKIYKKLLSENGEIHMKTDNMQLFEFSIESLSKAGFVIKNVSLDLHSSKFAGNIMTEYEQKFVSAGMQIYRLEAFLKGENNE